MNLTAILIVGIITWAIVSLTNGPKANKKADKVYNDLQDEHEKMKQELTQMAERLAVLEKIVTDEKYQLNKKFNALRD